MAAASMTALPFTVYVSPIGNDNADGRSAASAFATLTRARDAIRQHRASGGNAASSARVELACGRYDLVS